MGDEGITGVRLHPPRIHGQIAVFEWSVEPATELYRQTRFQLEFPPEIDLRLISPALWLFAGMMCLHTQWLLLRPCRVILPARLPEGELECWRRLLEVETRTLEGLRGDYAPTHGVEFVAEGPGLAAPVPLPEGGRWATAFSSGKDSLVQAAMLRELTGDPLLVAVSSELPGINDNSNVRKKRNLAEMAHKPPFHLVQVKSDFRSAWANDFSHRFDYGISVNEITDTLLYSAATIVCAAALGITHVCIASEAELNENLLVEGITIQHEQFMYSGATIGALNALLQRFGITYSSLVAPLYDMQIGALLQTRYADLAHLQGSCWMCNEQGTPCGICGKCTKTALTVFACGASPRRIGYDPIAVIEGLAAFTPRAKVLAGPLPRVRDQGRWRYDRHRVGLIQATPTRKVARLMLGSERLRLLTPRGVHAILTYHRLRRRLRKETPGPWGLPEGFFGHVDPAIRDEVRRILREHFPDREEGGPSEPSVARSMSLIEWITAPLAGRPGALPCPGQQVETRGTPG